MRRQGEDIEYALVLDELRERDFKDSTLAIAPLKAAGDAVRIKTDGLDIDEIVGQIERMVRERWNQPV